MKRWIALCLVVAFILPLIPAGVFAETIGGSIMIYNDSTGNGVVQNRSIKMDLVRDSTYLKNPPSEQNIVVLGTNGIPLTKRPFTFSIDTPSGQLKSTGTITASYNADDGRKRVPAPTTSVPYTIYSNLYSNQMAANGSETIFNYNQHEIKHIQDSVAAGSPTPKPPAGATDTTPIGISAIYGTDKVTSQTLITQTSEVTIRVTNGQEIQSGDYSDNGYDPKSTGNITFELINDPLKPNSGIFANCDSVMQEGSIVYTGEQKIVILKFTNRDSSTFLVQLKPLARNSRLKVDAKDNIVIDTAKKPNDWVLTGTEFYIKFEVAKTSNAALEVVTPQTVVNKSATTIDTDLVELQRDYRYKSKFIKFGKDTDGLDYITESFDLTNTMISYGEPVKVEWKATGPNADTVIEINPTENKSIDRANIKRAFEDVKLKLSAVITYSDPTFPPDVAGEPVYNPKDGVWTVETRPVDIVIKGTGTPPSIEKPIGTKTTSIQENLDYFEGTPQIPKPNPTISSSFEVKLNLGVKNGRADYFAIEGAESGMKAVGITYQIAGGNPTPYTLGSKVDVKTGYGDSEKTVIITFYAKQIPRKDRQQAVFKIVHYRDLRGKPELILDKSSSADVKIGVENNSPYDDAKLDSLIIKTAKGKEVPIDFKTDVYAYPRIDLPYQVVSGGHLSFFPEVNKNQPSKMEYQIVYYDNNNDRVQTQWIDIPLSWSITPKQFDLPLRIQTTSSAKIRVTAQDQLTTLTYEMEFYSMPPNADPSLASISVFDKEDVDHMLKSIPSFAGDIFSYTVNVPYRIDRVHIVPTMKGSGAKIPWEIIPAPVSLSILEIIKNSNIWNKLEDKETQVVIKTYAETYDLGQLNATNSYVLNIVKEDPSAVSTLDKLVIQDAESKEVPFTPVFDKNTQTYRVKIPYSISKLKFNVTPTYQYPTSITMNYKDIVTSEAKQMDVKPNEFTNLIDIDYTGPTKPNPSYNVTFDVLSEDGLNTSSYTVEIEREPPSDDAELKSLTIADQDAASVPFKFVRTTLNYDITVPYTTTSVTFTPTANFAKVSKIEIKSSTELFAKKIDSGTTSPPIKLAYPGVTSVAITVTAEDNITTKTYIVNITRKPPSSDAKLLKVEMTNVVDMKPKFVPSKFSYTAKVDVDKEDTVITATASSKDATITINGTEVESGKPTDPAIPLPEVENIITIEVTAQDGVTKNTYTFMITNVNLMPKSGNADLAILEVKPGEMTPKFQPSTTAYEVAVPYDTTSVDIIAVPADALAKMKVMVGTKEMGDIDGNYSQAIADGTNAFSIEVTSPDTKVVKVYTVNVNKNVKGKEGSYAPIDAKQIDWKQTAIVVDITKYTYVMADVFNELKKYPETTITFQGNDYSLTFKGSDIKNVVPNTQIFNLAMSFTSPNQNVILSKIYAYRENATSEPVIIHFPGSGYLPAKALLTVDIGNKYANRDLGFHYYNEKFNRLDYYGATQTNSRGSYSVNIDHFSDYITANFKLVGSEDRAAADAPKLKPTINDKNNPNTSVDE